MDLNKHPKIVSFFVVRNYSEEFLGWRFTKIKNKCVYLTVFEVNTKQ